MAGELDKITKDIEELGKYVHVSASIVFIAYYFEEFINNLLTSKY